MVYEAAGGADGLLRQVNAWHARVMADEVVSHAFSPGSLPSTASGSPPAGRSRSVAERRIQTATATRPLLCGCRGAPGLLHRRARGHLVTEYGLRVLSDFRRLGMQLDVAARPRDRVRWLDNLRTLALFDADVSGAVHDHTTHGISSNRRLIGGAVSAARPTPPGLQRPRQPYLGNPVCSRRGRP
jgi:hypothetical protein